MRIKVFMFFFLISALAGASIVRPDFQVKAANDSATYLDARSTGTTAVSLTPLNVTASTLAGFDSNKKIVSVTDIPTGVTIGGAYVYRAGGTNVPLADGGTNADDAAGARTNIGAAASGAATGSGLTMATGKLLGRTTGSSGAIEEITPNSTNFSFSGGALNTIQAIDTASTPQFTRLGLGAAADSTASINATGNLFTSASWVGMSNAATQPRAFFGYNGTSNDAVVQGISGKGIEFNVNNNTFGSGLAGKFISDGQLRIGSVVPSSQYDTAAEALFVVRGSSGNGGVNAAGAVFSSSLTSGRVTFATTDGAVTDDSDLTFAGDTLTATGISVGSTGLTVGAAGISIGSTGVLAGDRMSYTTSFAASTQVWGAVTPTLYMKGGEVQLSATKGITMPRAGSIIGISISWDVTASTNSPTYQVDVTASGGGSFSLTGLSFSVANDKKDKATQARGADTFAAGESIYVRLNNPDIAAHNVTVQNVIIAFEVIFDT